MYKEEYCFLLFIKDRDKWKPLDYAFLSWKNAKKKARYLGVTKYFIRKNMRVIYEETVDTVETRGV